MNDDIKFRDTRPKFLRQKWFRIQSREGLDRAFSNPALHKRIVEAQTYLLPNTYLLLIKNK